MRIEAKRKGNVGGGEGAGSKTFDAMRTNMGALVNKPMSREEALKILSIEAELDEELDHVHVMERFDSLFEKNLPENGGSFYI